MSLQREIIRWRDFQVERVANEGCVCRKSAERRKRFREPVRAMQKCADVHCGASLGRWGTSGKGGAQLLSKSVVLSVSVGSEEAFGSWLLRILIDEALLIRSQKERA
jgi:hypothetical protein